MAGPETQPPQGKTRLRIGRGVRAAFADSVDPHGGGPGDSHGPVPANPREPGVQRRPQPGGPRPQTHGGAGVGLGGPRDVAEGASRRLPRVRPDLRSRTGAAPGIGDRRSATAIRPLPVCVPASAGWITSSSRDSGSQGVHMHVLPSACRVVQKPARRERGHTRRRLRHPPPGAQRAVRRFVRRPQRPDQPVHYPEGRRIRVEIQGV
mmetsp:Transcript_7677/g.18587  ORF Transcript_7677/g.18587 Transcript_7677/m.18587 type:complete len:207 (+) Transcript_7677:215-835(+)